MVKKPELNNVWGKAVLMNTLSQCPYNVTEENNNKRTGSNNFFFHSGLKQLFLKQKSMILLRSYSVLQAECHIIR